MHNNPRIEKVLIQSQGVLKCCGHWHSDGLVVKTVLLDGLVWIRLVDFQEKHFFGMFIFHREMFNVTIF